MSHMTIMRGGPGSGKSTLARALAEKNKAVIVSADDFFVGPDGVYRFDPAYLGRAHARCFRRAVELVTAKKHLVVDNTNGTPAEMVPYLSLAQAFDYTVELVKVLCAPDVAFARQTHNVPRDVFDKITRNVSELQPEDHWLKAIWLTVRTVTTG